ncbi:hypothetical protein [Streptomyces sp. NPDC056683]|uniref:hypothetical protein n=1 Tax=Streptomyces sp. NPDC056683 TaxID=3345910 RepID=UPI0036CFE39B
MPLDFTRLSDDHGTRLRFTGAMAAIHAVDLVDASFTADFIPGHLHDRIARPPLFEVSKVPSAKIPRFPRSSRRVDARLSQARLAGRPRKRRWRRRRRPVRPYDGDRALIKIVSGV